MKKKYHDCRLSKIIHTYIRFCIILARKLKLKILNSWKRILPKGKTKPTHILSKILVWNWRSPVLLPRKLAIKAGAATARIWLRRIWCILGSRKKILRRGLAIMRSIMILQAILCIPRARMQCLIHAWLQKTDRNGGVLPRGLVTRNFFRIKPKEATMI